MSKKLFTLTAFMALLLGTGCVSHYIVVLNNGSSTTSRGKPRIKTQYETRVDAAGKEQKIQVAQHYEFKDVGGMVQRVPLSRIAQIYPKSDQGDAQLFYLPKSYDMPKSKKPWYSGD